MEIIYAIMHDDTNHTKPNQFDMASLCTSSHLSMFIIEKGPPIIYYILYISSIIVLIRSTYLQSAETTTIL